MESSRTFADFAASGQENTTFGITVVVWLMLAFGAIKLLSAIWVMVKHKGPVARSLVLVFFLLAGSIPTILAHSYTPETVAFNMLWLPAGMITSLILLGGLYGFVSLLSSAWHSGKPSALGAKE